jgi:sensor domain CHASE-containing protein
MKVKTRILLAVIPSMVLFAVLVNLAFGVFFQNFITQQEENQIAIAIDSLTTYYNDKIAKGQGSANDWGHWDDTYEFMESANPEYAADNLVESTFENLGINS